MSQTNISVAGSEVRSLIHEAQRMLAEAGVSSGERAEELKNKSAQLLASGISKAQELEKLALESGRKMAKSTDSLVHENPWGAIAIAAVIGAGIGFVAGLAVKD
ncbi:MAG: DUF883 domain-containing protein [Pseudomonadota bacterium]